MTTSRDEILDALEAAEAGDDPSQAEAWRRHLASVTPPRPLGAPSLPPVPVVFDSPTLRLSVYPSKQSYLMVSAPRTNRLYAMVRHALVCDVGAAPGRLWFVGALGGGQSIAQVDVDDADTAAAARAARQKLKLPRTPHDVTEDALREDPRRYHGAWVRVVGTWTHGFELSHLAGAWLASPLPKEARPPSPCTVRVVGRWSVGPSGHLGASRAALDAISVEPI